MELSSIVLFSTVVSLMVISPGPNGLLILKNVPLYGVKAGLHNVMGFVSAFYIHGTLTIFGLSLILLQTPALFFWVKVSGGLYLTYIGVRLLIKIFSRPKQELPIESEAPAVDEHLQFSTRHYFIWYSEGLVTNLLNPKVSLFYIAAFPQFIGLNSQSIPSAYLLVTIHASIALVWFSFLTFAVASSLMRFRKNKMFVNAINALSGTLLIAIGVNVVALR